MINHPESYLKQFSANYAAELKSGGDPNKALTTQAASGVENLVRARSVQAGAIKRLDILLTEETDTVTKSRLVGLLETQKAALNQMDGTLEIQEKKRQTEADAKQAAKDAEQKAKEEAEAAEKQKKLLLMIGGGVLFLGVLTVIVLLLKRKKNTTVSDAKNA
jgi:hypothetical protein